MRSIRKHTPQRTCVACRQVKAQQELVHLVRISNGSIEINTDGRKTGRGAYLCRTEECLLIGLNSTRLQHALRTTLTQDNREQLIRYGKGLLQEVNHWPI
ncbi:YlxR family protein [Chloroflexota bacterium]